jgi:hypothetical protein
MSCRTRAIALLAALLLPGLGYVGDAHAQTDEIQVYNAEIAPPGAFNLTLHNNYTPDGIKAPAFPGTIVSNGSWNGVPEWAYGVAPWMEAGLYLPLYSLPSNGDFQLDGFKLRALFVVPDAAKRSFFYGINFEFSRNWNRWEPYPYTSEIRPIVGWRFGAVDLIFNPILDNTWTGASNLTFAPATRLAYNFSESWAVAAEEYDEFGPLRHFYGSSQQSHQIFAVVDFSGQPVDVEFGAGFGLNGATDHFTLKLILSRDF